MKAADSLGLMKKLVVESFKQNPNSEAAKKLLQYEYFTHNTNEGSYDKTNPLESFDYFKNNELISQQEYEKAYQQATERRAKEIKFEAAKQIGFLSNEHNGTNLSDLTDNELDEGIRRLNQYKRKSGQHMDRGITTMMNIRENKPI